MLIVFAQSQKRIDIDSGIKGSYFKSTNICWFSSVVVRPSLLFFRRSGYFSTAKLQSAYFKLLDVKE
jgi:hypothetical protein